jgi:DNA-binding MarR family transcriptional regulator
VNRQSADAVPSGLVLGSGSLIHQVGRELNTIVERRLAEFDVTAKQAALLIHAVHGQTTPNQLTAKLGTDTAGMTRLLDRLEAKGLLRRQRHPDDRRSVVIELTDRGRKLAPRLAPVFGQVTGQALAGFAEDDVRHLSAMLRRILDNLDTTRD